MREKLLTKNVVCLAGVERKKFFLVPDIMGPLFR